MKKKDSTSSEKELLDKIYAVVRKSIGPVAAFKQAVIIDKLPKTRSGKIARNTLKSMINNEPFKVFILKTRGEISFISTFCSHIILY